MATAVHAAQVTYEAPDLQLMERFLTDFGLHRVAGSDENTLYMRGTGPQHHIHVTRRADRPGFVGATIEVATREDLDGLALKDGSSGVQPSSEPGGGWEVVMQTPDGVEIRAIWGREKSEPLPMREPNALNNLVSKPRANTWVRQRVEPCDVARLGHFVLHVSNHDDTVKWFLDRFNFLPSDYFATPEGTVYGTFIRLDAGDELVDHHFMLVLQSDWVGVHHCSFEVLDLDSVMSAHDYLLQQDYTLDVGVGRHLMGSQIFDYWKDPFGFRVEHYTDGDQVSSAHVPTAFSGSASETTQWGSQPPEDFFQ